MTRTVGLLVNPVAGLGGAAGLGGSDGADVQRRAAQRGGVRRAAERATAVLNDLRSMLSAHDDVLVVAPGVMGETIAAATGLDATVLDVSLSAPTSAADTTRCAAAFAAAGVDLLLFAGGDGTAADVARGCGERIPVLGIPSGVKMYSGCFAVNPRAAADIARHFLAGRAADAVADSASVSAPATETVEVVDLDEEALRDGLVRPRLTASLRVPVAPTVQSRKAPTAANVAEQVAAVAAAAAELLADGVPTALGPGGTTHAVAARLGLPGTLLGVDIACGGDSASDHGVGSDSANVGRLLAEGASEPELYDWATRGLLRIMVSVIGGQGFLFGRGNQQFSPRVLGAVGAANIVILAPEAKLAVLGGRPLLVDTGDADTDALLSGYRRILTGPGQWAVYPVGERTDR